VEALRQLGAKIERAAAARRHCRSLCPANARGGEVALDASASSQFVSALLLLGAVLFAGASWCA